MPASIRNDCKRAPAAEVLPHTTASLRCDLGLTADADTVWYHRYDTGTSMADYLTSLKQEQRLPLGSCSADVSRAQGTWTVGDTYSGGLDCYQADGGSWIVWTYGADRILARAVREGTTVNDWHTSDGHGLFDWWKLIRLFVESGG